MSRGSRPGERYSGRQRGTPNGKTVLAGRILAVASLNPTASRKELFAKLAQDPELPANLRIALVARPKSQSSDEAKSRPKSQARKNAVSLGALFLITQDPKVPERTRRTAAVQAVALLLPPRRERKKWGALTDQYGFSINPRIAEEYRDIQLELSALKKDSSRGAALGMQRIRKLCDRAKTISRSLQCPRPTLYGPKEFAADKQQLAEFAFMRCEGLTLTDHQKSEEALRMARFDTYSGSPEETARRELRKLRSVHAASKDSKEKCPQSERKILRLTPRGRAKLRALQLLYPIPNTDLSRFYEPGMEIHRQKLHAEKAEALEALNVDHPFSHAQPGLDGNFYAPGSKLRREREEQMETSTEAEYLAATEELAKHINAGRTHPLTFTVVWPASGQPQPR